MGGSMLAFNLANRPEFSLRELRDDPADRGLERAIGYISATQALSRAALSKAKMLLILVGSVSLVTVSVYLPSSNTPKDCAAVIA